MDVTQLLEPIFTPGIRNTNFFNGRVLTAEDLRTEQQANREQHRQLARALGDGVVHGLDVSAGAPVSGVPAVRIRPGLALNRDGDAVALGRTVDLLLVNRETQVPPEAGLFAVCMAPDSPLELTNVGLYVLTARPASALSEERAPMTDFGSEGIASSCASRWALEGVRFAVAPLPLAASGTTPSPLATELATLAADIAENTDLVLRGGASATPEVIANLDAALSRLRNGAAFLCFGADELANDASTPFDLDVGFPAPVYGAIDGMRERSEITSCEVPLALLYLSRRGIEWVDEWAVRRSPVAALTAGALVVLPRARATADAVAQVLQFQQQLRELRASSVSNTALAAIEATHYFRFLPPFGLVPIIGYGASRGMSLTSFFDDVRTGDPVPVPLTALHAVAAAALLHPPIDLASTQALQLFRPGELDDASRPPWVAFSRRGLRAVHERDDVARTLNDATNAYRAVQRRRTLLPATTDTDAAGARVSIVALLDDVIGTARVLWGNASAGLTDQAAALRAFDHMYNVQRELTELLLQLDDDISGHGNRLEFALGINDLLDEALQDGQLALGPAVQNGSVAAAVVAQDAINQLVAGWTGEGIGIGTIRLTPRTGSDAPILVPGSDTPFRYEYELRNNTDQTMRIRVMTSIGPADDESDLSGDWAGRISVAPSLFGTDEGSIVETGAARNITVAIIPPADAAVGESARLVVTSQALPPNNQADSHTTILQIGEEPGEPVDRVVEFTRVAQPTTIMRTRAPLNTPLSYTVEMRYTATTEPLSAPFVLEVVPVSGINGFLVQLPGASPAVFAIPRLLVANAPPESHRTTFAITTPGTTGQRFEFRIRIASPTLGISAETDVLTIQMA